jgi:hypothetical protein
MCGGAARRGNGRTFKTFTPNLVFHIVMVNVPHMSSGFSAEKTPLNTNMIASVHRDFVSSSNLPVLSFTNLMNSDEHSLHSTHHWRALFPA